MDKGSSEHAKSIVVVTEEFGLGGAERVLSELIKEWSSLGNKVTLFQTRPNYYNRSYDVANGVHTISINPKGKVKIIRYPYQVIALCKYLLNNKDAVVVAFGNPSICIVAICGFFVPNRIVFSERNDPRYCPSTVVRRWLRDRFFTFADVCVFQTEQAKKLFPLKAQLKGVVIPNPINQDLPIANTAKRNRTIITACRLTPQKNLPMLINAYAKLVKEYPEYELEIYGTGDEYDNLIRLIRQLDVENRARLMGHTSHIYEIMKESAMYICTSNYEGISNSLLEALCLGMPVISTDHPTGGARELIRDHVNGILIPVGDVEALYEAMKYLINNPHIAQQFSTNAVQIREKWPIREIAERWISLF